MSSPEHKQKIWHLIKDIRIGMLSTRQCEELRSRPMSLVQDEYDGTLWFFTDLESEKVFEVEGDHDVCVTFADPEQDVYVSLTGVGRAIQDRALIDKYWSPLVAAWFPEGKDSPNVGMLEIKVNKGEHWDSDSSKMIKTLKMTKAKLKKEMPNIGDHETFGMKE